jgi:hypothetical protein
MYTDTQALITGISQTGWMEIIHFILIKCKFIAQYILEVAEQGLDESCSIPYIYVNTNTDLAA